MSSSRLWYKLCIVLLLCPIVGHTVERGDIAPEFSLPILQNPAQSPSPHPQPQQHTLLHLNQFKGRVVYLDFWHSGCVPCRGSLPELNRLRRRYAEFGFEVIGVNLDPLPQQALAFMARYPVDFPVVWDIAAKSVKHYGLDAFPTGFLLNPEGRIAFIHHGYSGGLQAVETAVRHTLAGWSNKYDQVVNNPHTGKNPVLRI